MSDIGCGGTDTAPVLRAPRRNRYFYGKLLDAPHLDLEQRYGMDKRALLNRLALGFGVVCGLDVVPTMDGSRVRVQPGVAVDGWGREVVVPVASPPLDVAQLLDACGRPEGQPVAPGTNVLLWLAYHECPTEPVPVLVGDCDTERGCANSVVREQYALILQVDEELAPPPSCGFGSGVGSALHAAAVERSLAACAEPVARPWVPLARITVPEEGAVLEEGAVDRAVRPVVATNQLLLELVLCLADRVEACCGSGPAPTTLLIEKVSGDTQQAVRDTELPEPVVVRVVDNEGNLIEGEKVTFDVTGGGGSVQPVEAATDAQGRASTRWRLGSTPGANEIRAAISTGRSVRFSATATAPPVVSNRIQIVSGNGQSAPAGEALANPLVVRVIDQAGNGVGGEVVDFEGFPSGADWSPVQGTTDASGFASTRWTLAPEPTGHELMASIDGDSVTFTASVVEAPPTLPTILAVWPPNAAILENEQSWLEAWRDRPRVEITFDREMSDTSLSSPDRWLRMWSLSFDGEGAVCSRMRMEFTGRREEPMIGDPNAFTVEYTLDPEQAHRDPAFLILMRPAGDRIVDTSNPPQPLDVDFRGTDLAPDVMKQIWVTDGDFISETIFSAMVDTGVQLPQADGQPGREYDSWFWLRDLH